MRIAGISPILWKFKTWGESYSESMGRSAVEVLLRLTISADASKSREVERNLSSE